MNHPASHTSRYAIIVSIALGIVASSAQLSAAATLTTPPVYLPNDTTLMTCVLTNLSTKPLENITIEKIDQNGMVVASSTGTIQPGATGGGSAGGTNLVGWDYCRVDGVSKSKAILEACVQTSFGSLCQQTTVNR